jgi:hypothetical protein
MGSFDFPKIIAAAATSTLGVLSLVILTIAVLAYFFFHGSGDRVKLGVFAAMFVAAVGFGLATLRQTGTTAPPAKPAPPPATAQAAPPPTGQIEAASTEAAPAKTAAVQDITGTWRDEDGGFTYRVVADGSHFRYEALSQGVHAGSGEGVMDGRLLQYAYVDDRTGDRGSCTATLSTDGAAIDGRCGDGAKTWGFRATR